MYFRKILWLLALERLEEVKKQNQRDCCKTRDDGQRSYGGSIDRKINLTQVTFSTLTGFNGRQAREEKQRERDKTSKSRKIPMRSDKLVRGVTEI